MCAENPEPEFLYHYTSMQTLHILLNNLEKNKTKIAEYEEKGYPSDLSCYLLKFWGSHILYMNDPTENIFFIDCLKKALKEYEDETGKPSRVGMLSHVQSFIESTFGTPYFVSFCDNDRVLSMWRSYALNGCGVAIGFSYKALKEYIDNFRGKFELAKVNYYEEEKLIGYFTEEKLDDIWHSLEARDEELAIDPELIADIVPPNTFIKPEVYHEEKEWRIYTTTPIADGFREKNGLIIPYHVFEIPLDILDHIIVGPCAEQELSLHSLRMMIRTKLNGVQDANSIQVNKSDIPFVNR